MKCFVTGGAGFIGSHLVDRLIDDGNDVTVFDDLSSGKISFIKKHLDEDKIKFIKSDLIDYNKIDESLKGHDVVFHIAANPDVRIGADKPDIAKKDILITYNILDAMRNNQINKIVFSSSSTIYGETPPFKLPEDYGPLLPISVYGAAKLASEGLISSFCHTFNINGWIYRFANVVGERGTHGVIVDFINKLRSNPKELEILGDGKQKKPYLEVKDCVDGVLFGFNNSSDQINYFNLGCETVTEVNDIADMVVEEMKLKNVKYNYTGGKRGWKGDVPQFQFEVEKIKKIGWQAKYTSNEVIRNAIRSLIKSGY